jgi:hypothetical protein
VLILWSWTALLSGLVLYPAFTNRGNAVIPFAVLALGIGLYTVFSPSGRRLTLLGNGSGGDSAGPEADPGPPGRRRRSPGAAESDTGPGARGVQRPPDPSDDNGSRSRGVRAKGA